MCTPTLGVGVVLFRFDYTLENRWLRSLRMLNLTAPPRSSREHVRAKQGLCSSNSGEEAARISVETSPPPPPPPPPPPLKAVASS